MVCIGEEEFFSYRGREAVLAIAESEILRSQ